MNQSLTLRGRRAPSRLARIASAACLVAGGLVSTFSAHAQADTQVLEGVFTGVDSAPGWTISGSRWGDTRNVPTTDGSGWLRLASTMDVVIGQVQAKSKLRSNVPVRVEFDYLSWGSVGDDGLAIYFADASAASAGKGGKPGGGLGYCGMEGAYLGVGIDNTGNFSRWGCGQSMADVSGIETHGDAVSVRGPQSEKYPYVHSVSMDERKNICGTCTDRAQVDAAAVRRVVLDMVPSMPAGSGYVLNLKINGREILKDLSFPYAAPDELVMGLAATTGAGGSNHEVRNLKVSVQGPVTPLDCANGTAADGKCLPTENPLKAWDSFVVYPDRVIGDAPRELMDGDLAQKGWDGRILPALVPASLPDGQCLQFGLKSTGDAVPAKQVVIVSRQDDWANAAQPTESTEFTKHGAKEIWVSYSSDSNATWKDVDPPAMENNKVMRVFDLPAGTPPLTNVHVAICKTADGKTAPVTEILVR